MTPGCRASDFANPALSHYSSIYCKLRTCVKNTLYENTLANKKAIKLQAERKEPSSAQHWELQSLPQMDGTVFGNLPASEQIVRGGGLEER